VVEVRKEKKGLEREWRIRGEEGVVKPVAAFLNISQFADECYSRKTSIRYNEKNGLFNIAANR